MTTSAMEGSSMSKHTILLAGFYMLGVATIGIAYEVYLYVS
jgi:hypothetical protein